MILILDGLTTGLKTSPKSIPSFWWNPLATRRALYFWMLPLEFLLTWKTHLQPIALVLEGRGIRDQVWFLIRASKSSHIAFFPVGTLESLCHKSGFSVGKVRIWVGNNSSICFRFKNPILSPSLHRVCIVKKGRPCNIAYWECDSLTYTRSSKTCKPELELLAVDLWILSVAVDDKSV